MFSSRIIGNFCWPFDLPPASPIDCWRLPDLSRSPILDLALGFLPLWESVYSHSSHYLLSLSSFLDSSYSSGDSIASSDDAASASVLPNARIGTNLFKNNTQCSTLKARGYVCSICSKKMSDPTPTLGIFADRWLTEPVGGLYIRHCIRG